VKNETNEFVFKNYILYGSMKIAKKALQDVFFYSEDGHFLKVN
jgi:hypothetical protein